eukprot:TRINITY_DN1271_c1_g1_i1.p1 TRINITY_DN1271_c1_g1~~TRINITY_DN1271_c1_g1_i1.p1  ORF type:complete len:979 (+),score=215.28 TRINITY_DN1271_c1_g1_i1:95-2938(+)
MKIGIAFVLLSVPFLCQGLKVVLTELPVSGLTIVQKPTMNYGVFKFNLTTYFHSFDLGYLASCGDGFGGYGTNYGDPDGSSFGSESIVCSPGSDLSIYIYNDTLTQFSGYGFAKPSNKRSEADQSFPFLPFSSSNPINLTVFIEEKKPTEATFGSALNFKVSDFWHVKTPNASGYSFSNTPNEDSNQLSSPTWFNPSNGPHLTFQKSSFRYFLNTFTYPRSTLLSEDFFVFLRTDPKITKFSPNPVPFVTEGSISHVVLTATAYNEKIFCSVVGSEKPAYLSFTPLPDELQGGPEEYFPFYINETTQCVTFTFTDSFGLSSESDVQWHITQGNIISLSNVEGTQECLNQTYFPYRVSKQEGANSSVYATVRSKSGYSLVETRSIGTIYRYHDISLSGYDSFRKCTSNISEVITVVEETPVLVDLNQGRIITVQFASGQESALLKVVNSNANGTAFQWDINNLPFTFNSTGFPISATDFAVHSTFYNPFYDQAAFWLTNVTHYFVQVENPNFEVSEDGAKNYLEGSSDVSFLLNNKPVGESTFRFDANNKFNKIYAGFSLITITLPSGQNCFHLDSDDNYQFETNPNPSNSFNMQDFSIRGTRFCSRRSNVGTFTFISYTESDANFTLTFVEQVAFPFNHAQTFSGNRTIYLVLPPTSDSAIYLSGGDWFSESGQLFATPERLKTLNSFIYLNGELPGKNRTVVAQTATIKKVQLCLTRDDCDGFSCNSEGTCDYPVPTSPPTSSSSITSTSSSSSSSSSSASSGLVKTTKAVTFNQDSTSALSVSSSNEPRFTSTVPNAQVTEAYLAVSGRVTEEQAKQGLEIIEKTLLQDSYDNNTRRFEFQSVEYSTAKRADSTKINFRVNEVEGSENSSVDLIRTLQDEVDKNPNLLMDAGFNDAKLEVVSINYAADEPSGSTSSTASQFKNAISSGNKAIVSLLLVQILVILL